MQYDAEIVLAFIEEIAEYLPQIRQHLDKLARKPRDKDALEEAYRLSHTIKGSSAMLDLNDLSNQGRILEQSLLPVVEKKAQFTPALAQELQTHVDTVERLLNKVRAEMEMEGGNVAAEPVAPAPAPRPNVMPPPPPPLPHIAPPLSAYQDQSTPIRPFVPPPPPPARAAEPFQLISPEEMPDFFNDMPDMPPIGFNQALVPPPPPPPGSGMASQNFNLPDFSAGPSVPDWLNDLPPQLQDVPADVPPPPPPASEYQHYASPVSFEPPLPPGNFRPASLPESKPSLPPPSAPAYTASSAGVDLPAELDLMDFSFDPNELDSLSQDLFVAEDSFAPINQPFATPYFDPAQLEVDFQSFEPQIEEQKDALPPSVMDNTLEDILTTNSVDRDIDALQSEILTELPPHLAEFNALPLPADISVSDAELLMSLGSDTTNPGLTNLQGLDNGTQLSAVSPALPTSFPPANFDGPAPSDLETDQLHDFTAAADLLAELAPGEVASEETQTSATLDDVPTVRPEPFEPAFDERDFASLPGLEAVSTASALDLTDLHTTLNAGQEDHAATLAGFGGLRGLPAITPAEADEEARPILEDAHTDAHVVALRREIEELPDELTQEQLAEAGFSMDDTELGAYFLAEGQGDLNRLKGLVADFAGPDDDDSQATAARIAQVCAELRKAAEMMDLESVGRQLSVMENTSELVRTEELSADATSHQLFQIAYDELMALLAPYQEAAANLFALPPPDPALAASDVDLETEESDESEGASELAVVAPASPALSKPPVVMPVGELDAELAEVFATEAQEHIENLDTRLAALEHDPQNRELLREIRRTAHTLKGSAAMVGFGVISQTAHLMEDLLDRLYDGTRAVDSQVVELLFLTFNAIDIMVRGLSAARPEDPQLLEDLRPHYAAMLSDETQTGEDATEAQGGAIIFAPKIEPATIKPVEPALVAARKMEDADLMAMEAAIEAANADPVETAAQPQRATSQTFETELAVRVPIKRLDTMMNQIGELVINRTVLERRNQILTRTVDELTLSIRRLQRVTRELETRYEVELLKNEAVPVAALPNGNGNGNGNSSRLATLDYPRYDYDDRPAGEFDTLEMDRYTEFHTLSREMTETTDDLAAALRELDHLKGDLENAVVQQARLTDDLQDRVVKVRLVPVSNLTPRLYRTVRSLAAQEQKEVEFGVSGEHTQLDKTIFEELGDPLLHLVRNAIDHGIELPDEREAAGKPRSATLTFAARTEGSQVVIEVRDDGRGIALDVVREAGVRRGLIAPDTTPTDEEIYDLLFVPGFSTSETVTDISGRGVGLDVVRANIARLKGTVEVQSEPGKGTTFILRLPSTLAISRALLVKVAGYTYAIPLSSIERTIRTEADAIENYDNRSYYRLAEGLLPLLELNQLLQLHSRQQRPPDEEDENMRSQFAVRRERPLLLINGPERAVVRVDALIGQQEVVVKPLGTHLKNVPGVTGATILGSGEVILILNPYELVSAATGRRTRYASGSRLPQALPLSPRRVGTGSLQDPRQRRRIPLVQVVDDSLSIRKVLTVALEKAGFRVRTSKDGQEALEMVQQVPPDLIIMDIEMPRMDGYELTSLLKSRDSFRRIPIIMLTSRAGLKHRQKAEEVGANGFLVKPYREQELLQIVSTLLVMSR